MKSIASLSGGWCLSTNLIQCEGHNLLVYPTDYGSRALVHQLPELMSFRDVIKEMNKCPSDIYILPERDS